MTPLMIAGLVISAGGFCVLFSMLGRYRSLNKAKQLATLRDVLRGLHGPGDRRVLILALLATFGGVCVTFGGVAQYDARRADACRVECGNRGYRVGAIRGSRETYRDGKGLKHRFVACACTEGPTPELELNAEGLVF